MSEVILKRRRIRVRKLSYRCLALNFIKSYFKYEVHLLSMTHVTVWYTSRLLCFLDWDVARNWKSINFYHSRYFHFEKPFLSLITAQWWGLNLCSVLKHLSQGTCILKNLVSVFRVCHSQSMIISWTYTIVIFYSLFSALWCCIFYQSNSSKFPSIIHRGQFFFLFIGWDPTTWPEKKNCLQKIACSYAMSCNWVWLQIIFCSCVKMADQKQTWWSNDKTVIVYVFARFNITTEALLHRHLLFSGLTTKKGDKREAEAKYNLC